MSEKQCSASGCERGVDSRGWCLMHYKRWRKHGDPEYVRAVRTCEAPGCGGTARARGWCGKHYAQWLLHGDALRETQARLSSPEERFEHWATPVTETDCIIWTGACDGKGYGQITISPGVRIQAHRYAWEAANGPIPMGKLIDHRCRVRACVNHQHLRPATAGENPQNLDPAGRGGSGYRGVSKSPPGSKKPWRARVQVGGRGHSLGTFDTAEEAARAAALKRLELMPFTIEEGP